jgi:hypothetical protein
MTTTSTRATVRNTLLKSRKPTEVVATVGNVCSAGSGCTAVQNDPVSKQALGVLQTAYTTAQTSLGKRLAAAQALLAAIKELHSDIETVHVTLATYEAAVKVLAGGDPTIINQAGLLTRATKTTPAALGPVTVVHSKPGKHQGEAIISWPKGPGATGYAIEANFTPQTPAGPWTALNSGTGRRRVVKVPTVPITPGTQFLVRVASLGSDGSQSDW